VIVRLSKGSNKAAAGFCYVFTGLNSRFREEPGIWRLYAVSQGRLAAAIMFALPQS